MAKKPIPPVASRFKPGQSGNPGGKPKVPDDILKARKLNQIELERVVNKYLWLQRDEVQAAIKDPATPMMELMVASIVAQAAQKGDQVRLEFILARLIGRVKDTLEVVTPTPFIIRRGDGTQVVCGSTLGSAEAQESIDPDNTVTRQPKDRK